MFSKVLVATDLSEGSDHFICTLGNLKAIGTRDVLLVHCFNVRDVGGLSDSMKEQAVPILEKQKKALEEQGLNVAAKTVVGLPHMEIHRIADEEDCSLIAVGSHGQTMASDYLLGGVVSAVIQSATRPVLILRLKWKEEDGRLQCAGATCNPLARVLYPTDFSDNAERAFSYVEKLAAGGAKQVTLAHVQDKTRIEKHLAERLDEFMRIDQDRLERLQNRLNDVSDAQVDIRIPYGRPAEEILRIAGEMDPDGLIVMGSQGRGFWAQVFLGGVSAKVAYRAPVPVLLVPALR